MLIFQLKVGSSEYVFKDLGSQYREFKKKIFGNKKNESYYFINMIWITATKNHISKYLFIHI